MKWLAIVLFAACTPRTIELGHVDAAADTVHSDASTCRCRITPCRVPGDCALVGGVCGADMFCVGDFGACTTSAQCQATATDSICTASATSTALCP